MSNAATVNNWVEADEPPPEAELHPSPRQEAEGSDPFCRIPRYIIENGIWAKLKGAEAKLLGTICFFANRKRGYRAWPRISTLARRSGLHPETIRIAKATLKKHGLIDFDWAPKPGGGHLMWVAAQAPHRFSDDHRKHKDARWRPE